MVGRYTDLENLARMQHWWEERVRRNWENWPQRLLEGDPPSPALFWWLDPDSPKIRSDEGRHIVRQVVHSCKNLDEERDYLQPFERFYERYSRLAVRYGASVDRAHDIALEILIGRPASHSTFYEEAEVEGDNAAGANDTVDQPGARELEQSVSGYLQNPDWLPLNKQAFYGRVKGSMTGGREVSLAEDWDVDEDEAPSGVIVLGKEHVQSRDELKRFEEAQALQERMISNGPIWDDLYRNAYDGLRPRERELIDEWGPWDRMPGWSAGQTQGWYPPRVRARPLTLEQLQARAALRPQERQVVDAAQRQAKSRARRRFLERMGERSPYGSLDELAHAILSCPDNEDMLSDVRRYTGFDQQWREILMQRPYPEGFARKVVIHACEQRLTIPPFHNTDAAETMEILS